MECHICGNQNFSKYCEKDNHKLYRCVKCDFIFVYPTPENLSDIYKEDYFHDVGDQEFGYTNYDDDKDSMKHVFELYLDRLEELVKNKNIFDVGCATGYFLDIAKNKGWSTHGIEISDYAGETSRERGHDVVTGLLPDVGFSKKMDAVTLWDVLEHVDNPKTYLRAVNKIMNKEGYLAINTVDTGSWWAKLTGKRWHLIVPPEHLNYYNKENLRLILEKTGFEMVDVKKMGKRFSLPYFFNTGYRWQGLRLWKIMADFFDTPFWRKFSMPVNFRDNIFVLAKKISDV